MGSGNRRIEFYVYLHRSDVTNATTAASVAMVATTLVVSSAVVNETITSLPFIASSGFALLDAMTTGFAVGSVKSAVTLEPSVTAATVVAPFPEGSS